MTKRKNKPNLTISKSTQRGKITKMLILLLGIIAIVIVSIGIEMLMSYHRSHMMVKTHQTKGNGDTMQNEYQTELNGIFSSDFTLTHSQLDNMGMDAGAWLTDTYTTNLSGDQAVNLLESNVHKKGYQPFGTTGYLNSCKGGILSYYYNQIQSGKTGLLDFCVTKVSNNETTFEVELGNFGKISPSASSGTCIGDCKQ